MATQDKLQLEYIPLDTIGRWPRNPKLHDMDRLRGSIQRFGFVDPMIRDAKSGRLVAGHGRLGSLEKLKADGAAAPDYVVVKKDAWLVPVVTIEFTSEREAEDFLLFDNRSVELGGWVTKLLAPILAKHDKNLLDAVGFESAEVDRILQEAQPEKIARGKTPEELAHGYNAGAIKQIVVYFRVGEFDAVANRMQKAGAEMGVDTGADTLLGLLDAFEAKAAR